MFPLMYLEWRQTGDAHVGTLLFSPVFAAMAYLFWVPILALVAHLIGSFFPPVGIGARAMLGIVALLLLFGDPILYLLYRKRPDWLPVQTFRAINFAAILYVKDPNRKPLPDIARHITRFSERL